MNRKKKRINSGIERENFWSRFAEDFDERNKYVVGKHTIQSIDAAVSDLNLSGTVLEIGCGNGMYSKTIAKTAKKLYAADLSDEMVQASEKKLSGHRNIIVEKQNCFNLGYPEEKFDSVVMINLLHVIPNPEQALMECHRVLKNKAKIFIISLTGHGMTIINKIKMSSRYLKAYGKPPSSGRVLTENNTTGLAERSGFNVERAELLGSDMKFVFVSAVKEDDYVYIRY